ncbi:MAG TPA: hypothetical protein VJ865_08735, partial [Gemmatimonadaceae bacterium]|nr:hypothetical protein [Gemmatimonadaceae bacterium]
MVGHIYYFRDPQLSRPSKPTLHQIAFPAPPPTNTVLRVEGRKVPPDCNRLDFGLVDPARCKAMANRVQRTMMKRMLDARKPLLLRERENAAGLIENNCTCIVHPDGRP